jgi:acyl-coenzyme A synthetase/AMP-(fatty) acid ligase
VLLAAVPHRRAQLRDDLDPARTIDYAAELPRDPNGKLYKRRLRDAYWPGRDRAI